MTIMDKSVISEPERVLKAKQQCAESLEKMKATAEAGKSECRLCREPAPIIGCFVPDASFNKRIGAPAGKTRLVFYFLCEDCSKLPDCLTLVEAAILRTSTVQ
jgi:hypothetical protein